MGNKDKNQGDSATNEGATGDFTSPRDVRHTNRDLSQERSQGHHPSQASSRGHSKGDGQGSRTLPGFTQ